MCWAFLHVAEILGLDVVTIATLLRSAQYTDNRSNWLPSEGHHQSGRLRIRRYQVTVTRASIIQGMIIAPR
jgi:hypothetical protein